MSSLISVKWKEHMTLSLSSSCSLTSLQLQLCLEHFSWAIFQRVEPIEDHHVAHIFRQRTALIAFDVVESQGALNPRGVERGRCADGFAGTRRIVRLDLLLLWKQRYEIRLAAGSFRNGGNLVQVELAL